MSKVIKSPVERFAGSITLFEPLTLPQTIAVEDAIAAARELVTADPNVSISRYNHTLLPGLLTCVEKVEIAGLENVTADTWPGTPKKSAALLTAWLTDEVIALFQEAVSVPNE